MGASIPTRNKGCFKRFADDKEVETEVAENNQKTFRLWVSKHGTSVLMLMEDMSRNKCFSQVRITHVLRFIPICDLFTDSPSCIRGTR
jgi:hypothetical protein